MDRLWRARNALPLGVLVVVSAIDLLLGRGQVVYTLLVISPVIAAAVLGRRPTAGYAAAALVLAALLGGYDGQYTAETAPAQTIRLTGLLVGGALAVVASTVRLRQEAQLRQATGEAARARSAVQLAEQLQRTLLTDPPPVAGLQLAVRYLPAVQHAAVGGDWYDAFPLPDGGTLLVIGDVAGHDVTAASTMAAVRGVLRGIAQTVHDSPAAVLSALDRALDQLGGSTMIPLVVATAHRQDDGTTLLRWSNAGHPPPVLVRAGGTAEVLQRRTDLVLGVDPDARREDHQLHLAGGDTVLLYTDGLVERRGISLDEGTAWLVAQLDRLADLPLEPMCDALLADVTLRLDDVAVLAVRAD